MNTTLVPDTVTGNPLDILNNIFEQFMDPINPVLQENTPEVFKYKDGNKVQFPDKESV